MRATDCAVIEVQEGATGDGLRVAWYLGRRATRMQVGPAGEPHQPGGVVPDILRERRRTHHEHIGHVPALRIAVEHTVRWIGADDGATGGMGGL